MAEKTGKEIKDSELLLETYKLYMARYNAIFPAFYEDLKFYAGLIAAIVGGTLVILKDDLAKLPVLPGWFSIFVAILAGSATIGVSMFGSRGIQHSYKAWLVTISSLAKLESELGLHRPGSIDRHGAPRSLWPNESIVSPTHVHRTYGNRNSAEFVQAVSRRGYRGTAEKFFSICWWIGVAIVVLAVAMAAWKVYAGK